MTTSVPSNVKTVLTSEAACALTFNKFYFDFADKAYAPTAIAALDLLQIGTVPAGEKLVPHLCRIDMIAIDSGGSPTGDYSIGTSAASTALKGSAASETAVTLSGEDFVLATSEIGDKLVPTPIYVAAINPSAAVPTTGKIVAWLVSRPWRSELDG